MVQQTTLLTSPKDFDRVSDYSSLRIIRAFPLKFLRKTNFLNEIEVRYSVQSAKGWNNIGLLKKEFPKIKFDKTRSFYHSLESSRAFLTDHIGTSFLEALQFNIPSLVFLNKDTCSFRDEFDLYFKELIKCKVIFYDPEECSCFLNEVYNNIDDWWSASTFQKLRSEVCDNYAYTSDKWYQIWTTTLKKLHS